MNQQTKKKVFFLYIKYSIPIKSFYTVVEIYLVSNAFKC